MNGNDTISLPPPSIPRGLLDGIILSSTIVADVLPEYFRVRDASIVGYLYLVNPEHTSHDGVDLEPILCTLAYDPDTNCYLVSPHGEGCIAQKLASALYATIADEHRGGAA